MTSLLHSHEAGTEPSRLLVKVAGIMVLLLVAAALGMNATENTTIVFAFVMLVAALPLVNGRPVTWVALALTVVWTSRLLTVAGPAPRFLDFVDFPLVLVAFVLAGVRYLNTDRRLSPALRTICRWLLVVTVAIALSWAFAGLAEPQRLLAGWVLAVEPFLLLVAVLLTPMTTSERRRLIVLTAVLLCGQAIFSAAQFLAGAAHDEVKGTLLATGAGHHVSAGGLAVGFAILARQRVPKALVLAYGAVALWVMIAADAKQVLFVLPLALLVLGVTGRRRRRSAVSLIGGLLVGVLMAGAATYALLTYQATTYALDFVDRSVTYRTGKVAVAEQLWVDITESPHTALFGMGPGQSVSRFSYLTTPGLLKAGSPVALLGLSESQGADRYQAIAEAGPFTGDSSFTAAQSSALGILGDYGLVGVLAFSGLIWAVINALRRATDTRLRSSALAAWALLLPLSVVFDWLEQPPFTLAVMVITGLALRGPETLSLRTTPIGRDLRPAPLGPAVRSSVPPTHPGSKGPVRP